LSISSGAGGYTTPSGTQEYLSYTYVNVTAVPDNSSMVFDGWLLDDVDMGCNPAIKVYMDEPHTLEAAFTTRPEYDWVSSIDDYDSEFVNTPENLVGWRPDGFFAGLAGFGPYQEYGWISAAMNEQTAGRIYLYGNACYCTGRVYVYVSTNGDDWNFVSSPYVSQGSPYWIDCGLYLSPFNYIMLTAEDPNTMYSVAVDSVRVEP
jgi:hypothetical protein